MIPRMTASRLSMAASLGVVLTVAPLPGAASEKAIITAPAVAPRKAAESRKQVESRSALDSFKSGGNEVNVDAIPLPSVPSIDPKAARQLKEKLAKEKDWLLEGDIGQPTDPTKALEEAWELGDSKSGRAGAIERRLRSKDRETAGRDRGDKRDRDGRPTAERTPRRGQTDSDDDEEVIGRANTAKSAGFTFPGGPDLAPKDLNPFESASKSAFNDRVGGQQAGFVTKADAEFTATLKSSEADYGRRMERLGLTGAADGSMRDPILRADTLGQERQMRVDQFTQALGGTTGSAFSGLAGATAEAGALSLPSFSKPPTSVGSFFDKPVGGDLARPFSSPIVPDAGPSRATDFLRNSSGFAPLPRSTF